MKKQLTSIIFILLVCLSFSNPINVETAKKVAQNFLSERRSNNTIGSVVSEQMNEQPSLLF